MSKTKILNLDMMSLQNIDEDSDLIPLMTSDDEEAISKESLPKSLPILPLKNTVMFPGVVIPITASRDKSIKLIKESNINSKLIGVVLKKIQQFKPLVLTIFNQREQLPRYSEFYKCLMVMLP